VIYFRIHTLYRLGRDTKVNCYEIDVLVADMRTAHSKLQRSVYSTYEVGFRLVERNMSTISSRDHIPSVQRGGSGRTGLTTKEVYPHRSVGLLALGPRIRREI